MPIDPFRTMKAARFLVTGPAVLALVVLVNWMTSPGHWWAQWAALGIGIAWVASLFRVLRAIVVTGGLAALAVLLHRARQRNPSRRAGAA